MVEDRGQLHNLALLAPPARPGTSLAQSRRKHSRSLSSPKMASWRSPRPAREEIRSPAHGRVLLRIPREFSGARATLIENPPTRAERNYEADPGCIIGDSKRRELFMLC